MTLTDDRPYGLTALQVAELLKPIDPVRVHIAQGHSHVAAYDVIAELNFLFGFDGWDKTLISLDEVFEDEKNGRYTVCYRCVLRLTVKDQHGNVVKVSEDVATGSAKNMPSRSDAHDFACKNAVSYALKRTAKDLGDQLGLSLYNKGMLDACVVETLITRILDEAATTAAAPQTVARVVPAVESMGNDEIEYIEPEAPTADERPARGSNQRGSQRGRAPSATEPPAGDPPDDYWLGAWLRCYERLDNVLGSDEADSFRAWGKANGYRSQARTQPELDALVAEAQARVRKIHPAHQWKPGELDRVQSAIAEMCDPQSPLARERDQYEAFAFDEFADPFHPDTWTEDQFRKLSPVLFGFDPSDTSTSSEDPTHEPAPVPA